jgi:phosphoribosylanthranilate isomerase
MSRAVKICGLSTEETIEAAVQGGATHLGFVFYPRSPRAVSPSRGRDLARLVPPSVTLCGLFVDAEEAAIEAVLERVPLSLLQLHGAESPEFCARLRQRLGRPVMKAIGIRGAEDVAGAERWIGSTDWLLFDARPPAGGLPGGNGVSFDWSLLAERRWIVPWMLSGGLTANNLAEAIRLTRPPGIDVSSGVESSPGIKDPARIRDFLALARTLP